MGSDLNNPPLIVIVGQTASGKTGLTIELANHFGIEIIAADARTIYKGMDVGTAKPSKTEQQAVPHHLIDIVSPGDIFTVADFKRLAYQKIAEISRRGGLPIMVGGSGLYIYSVIYDFTFRGSPNYEERKRLEGLSIEQLQALIKQRGVPMPFNSKNPRHLIGVLETGKVIKGQNSLRPNTLVLGLDIAPEVIEQNIHNRIAEMFELGLEDEVRRLVELYGWQAEALQQTIGYEEFQPYFEGKVDIQEVIRQIELHTKRFAKRQKTWFKHNSDIKWISKVEDAVDLVTTFLNK